MKISQRLTLLFLAIGLLPLVIFGFFFYYNSSKALTAQITGQIKSVGQKQSNKIQAVNEANYETLGTFLEKFQLKSLLRDYEVNPTPKILSQLNSIISQYKAANTSLYDVSVTNPSGRVILSTDSERIGQDLSKHEKFGSIKNGGVNTSIFHQEEGGLENHLLGSFELNGTVIGYAELEAETDSYINIARDYDLLGNTGGTQLLRTSEAGKSHYLLPLRFDEKSTLKEINPKALTAIKGNHNDDLVYFEDYRGQEVMAAAYEIPQTDWTMIVKIDKTEVLQPVHKLRNISFAVISVGTVAMAATALWFSKIITAPIQSFTDIVGRMKDGDLSGQVRAKVDRKDEIGELAAAFNDMADKIQFAFSSLKEHTLIAQNEKQVLQTLLDNLPVGVLVVQAPNGEPIMMNKAGEAISGRTAQSHITSNDYSKAYDVIREDGSLYPPEELPLTITLKTGKTVMKDNMFLRRPDGSTVAIRAITTPIKGGSDNTQRAVSVFEDITEERNLERSREEFFSIASHELRTPLTAIRGNTDMIHQYFGEQLTDPNLKEMIDDIHESSVRLIEIVNDFLDTSRLEQKKMKFNMEDFDAVAVAESTIRQYQVTGSRKKVLLQSEHPDSPLPMVHADASRTKQVLINLVGNALKFTDEGSVTISFGAEGDHIKVFIIDTGKGIPYDAQERLFRKFEQAGATVLTRDSVKGTGLGLYISRLIVEQMGGHIKLESSVPGKGTTFSFTLPIAKEAVSQPQNRKTAISVH